MTKRKEIVLLAPILIFSAFIRLYQLGYSHFYGDETKTLFLRKDVSAFNFLMDQRKGPMQFLASWGAEKISGGYEEGAIRLPFALAGILLVGAFYVFVRQNFGVKTALFSTVLFSVNGFYIAFSRTAQYQVLYLLFGFLALIFAKIHTSSRRFFYLAASVFCLALSLLSHYDAVFFYIPLFFIVGKKDFLKIALLGFVLSALFYIPNIYLGYFESNTLGYISKRFTGENYLRNNSLYTFLVYNPLYIYEIVLVSFFVVAVLKVPHKLKKMLLVWVLVPFAVFEVVINNPGTHIHNYLIPIMIFSGMGLDYLISNFKRYRVASVTLLSCILLFLLALQLWVFLPVLNNGYPWAESDFLGLKMERVRNDYHLYLYGFPYYREWDKTGQYFTSLKGVRNFYTNDNETVAEYYLYGIPHIPPGSNFTPQYYLEVKNPQELKDKPLPNPVDYEEVNSGAFSNIRVYKKVIHAQN